MKIKKRIYSVLCASAVLLAAIPFSGATMADFQYTALDINGDGEVSSFDALVLMQYISGNRSGDEIILENADINNDGYINSADALTLMRIVSYHENYSSSEEESSSSSNSSESYSTPDQTPTNPTLFANGIDVSKWQGSDINWTSVKDAGYDFAILRAGYGRYSNQKDECFETNYANAKAAGIDVGAYHFSYARTVEEARTEAAVCLEWLEGKSFEYPIFYDVESQTDLGVELTSQIIEAFCTELENAGYYVGIYSYANYLKNYVSAETITKYPIWVAHHNVSSPSYTGHDIWQYTDTGAVNGISGDVDLNYCYTDFETYIKANNLNGF